MRSYKKGRIVIYALTFLTALCVYFLKESVNDDPGAMDINIGSVSTASIDAGAPQNRTPPGEFGALSIKNVFVVDNGEGEERTELDPFGHGPYGSLHILIYEADIYADYFNIPQERYPKSIKHLSLHGPSKKCWPFNWLCLSESWEWRDGDNKIYTPPLKIFNWRSADDRIFLFIYESDPGEMFGYRLGRKHNPLFRSIIKRSDTLKRVEYASFFSAGQRSIDEAIRTGKIPKTLRNTRFASMYISFETLR